MNEPEQFETIGDALLVRAPPKLNLSLLIAGKRDDGFHEIETIMAKINLYDEVQIRRTERAGIELVCEGPHWAPPGPENLVYRAAHELLDATGVQANLSITLLKNVPAGTGLGSASSDAAATLLGVNKFLRLRAEPQLLHRIAARLGSDVPFFLGGPQAFCTGKGEKLRKITPTFRFAAVLIVPDISVSTKEVYAHYRHNEDLYRSLHEQMITHFQNNRIDLVVGMCANMLQESSFARAKQLRALKEDLESMSIRPVCLSGSGSAMFCICGDDISKAHACQDAITRRLGCACFAVRSTSW